MKPNRTIDYATAKPRPRRMTRVLVWTLCGLVLTALVVIGMGMIVMSVPYFH